MKVRILTILAFSLLAVSCSKYDKLLKSTDYEMKKAKAREFYDAGQYVKATELLAQILPRYRATEEAEELNWMNAQSYFGMKDYVSGSTYYKAFLDQFPFGKHAEDANYMAALCDYKISPRAELDQENTKNAIDGFNIFLSKYPSSPKADDAKKMLKELQEILVEKSYLSAKLYYDMKQYKAAVVALTNSLKDFSESKYREEMLYLKLSSMYLYAYNSLDMKKKERYQAVLDDYYSYMEEYPKSVYDKEVNNIFQKTNKYLKTGVIDKEVKK
jgi:outer membrane protein assembly factor BamD